jgi:hypothetical protein
MLSPLLSLIWAHRLTFRIWVLLLDAALEPKVADICLSWYEYSPNKSRVPASNYCPEVVGISLNFEE